MSLRLSALLPLVIVACLHAQQPLARVNPYHGYEGFRPGFIVFSGETVARTPVGLVLAVDGNPNPHGWYFTPPTFEDHPVEGRWTDDGMVLDGKT